MGIYDVYTTATQYIIQPYTVVNATYLDKLINAVTSIRGDNFTATTSKIQSAWEVDIKPDFICRAVLIYYAVYSIHLEYIVQ